MVEIPSGISGTAELISCVIDSHRIIGGRRISGVWFRAIGKILTPLEYYGLYTIITRPLIVEREINVRWILNELVKLGMPDEIESLYGDLNELVMGNPVFKFRTWLAYRGTNREVIIHEWHGLVNITEVSGA